MRTELRDLTQLFHRGCIEICTPDLGKDRPTLLRSLIQLDADILLMVDPKVFQQPELIQHHLTRCQKPARNLRRIRLGLNSAQCLAPSTAVYAVWHGCHGNYMQIALGGIATIVLLLIKSLVLAWLNYKFSGKAVELGS